MNQIWSRQERKGHKQMIERDGLRKDLDELGFFGPEMKSTQELQQCRLLGMGWFPCALPLGKAGINISEHVREQAGHRTLGMAKGGWDCLFGWSHLFDLTTKWGREIGGCPKAPPAPPAPPVLQILSLYELIQEALWEGIFPQAWCNVLTTKPTCANCSSVKRSSLCKIKCPI